MSKPISPNTQAILLLTAPLMVGRSSPTSEILSLSEYKRLARVLRDHNRSPADLLAPEFEPLLAVCKAVVEPERLSRLLGRGFLLGQAIERWQSRSIWVLSRADAEYPKRLKIRLREDAPPVIYGCGDMEILESGGLAVVGSRNIGEKLAEYSATVGGLAAKAGRTVVSGGAKGVDRAAMNGAILQGGCVVEVMAERLERAALDPERREFLIDRRWILVSAYDPGMGFNVGHAMQRNKLIYALSDAALVVNSDINKGGTWAGATEQLEKLKLVPVYVRSTGEISEGLVALQKRGAIPWPNPMNEESMETIFSSRHGLEPGWAPVQAEMLVQENGELAVPTEPVDRVDEMDTGGLSQSPQLSPNEDSKIAIKDQVSASPFSESVVERSIHSEVRDPGARLLATVREILIPLLASSMTEAQVASILGVSVAQAKQWLQRFVEDGFLVKQGRPASYRVNPHRSLID